MLSSKSTGSKSLPAEIEAEAEAKVDVKKIAGEKRKRSPAIKESKKGHETLDSASSAELGLEHGQQAYLLEKFEAIVLKIRALQGTSRIPQFATILLVEDSFILQKLAKRHLDSLLYIVEVAQNGQEAVEMFKKKQYDVIFMDVEMPVMDGIEATKQIRALEKRGEHTPIIAFTTSFDQFHRECFKAGMNDFCPKAPIRRKSLDDVLSKWTSPLEESGGILSLSADDAFSPCGSTRMPPYRPSQVGERGQGSWVMFHSSDNLTGSFQATRRKHRCPDPTVPSEFSPPLRR